MSSRIKIKMGPIEVEYEGSEEFLKEKLLGFLSDVLELYKSTELPLSVEEVKIPPGKGPKVPPPSEKIQLSTGTIASNLGCKTGPDLIIAACAHLTFVVGKQSFTRQEIHEKMKTATGHYKETYFANLSSSFNRLIKKNKLNELTTNKYALNDTTRTDLEQKLDIK